MIKPCCSDCKLNSEAHSGKIIRTLAALCFHGTLYSANDERQILNNDLWPRSDQRTICAAPRASGRPYPLHDPARSAAQIARSSRTPLNWAAVATGFRPRLGPRHCAMAPSAPNSHTLRLRSTSRVPTSDRSLVKRH